jgi:hypothetical protein
MGGRLDLERGGRNSGRFGVEGLMRRGLVLGYCSLEYGLRLPPIFYLYIAAAIC